MEQKIMVETSARHVHLSDKDLEQLFGKGYELTVKKHLSQPGQYAAQERVEVVGPKGTCMMTVLGPVRDQTQVEISLTDARTLGITAPVRESGNISGSGGCTLKGPKGEVILKEGVIVPKRHMHVTPEDASELNVRDKDVVFVKVDSESRPLIFGGVVVRVSPSYSTAIHIDTDESNALGASGEVFSEIVAIK